MQSSTHMVDGVQLNVVSTLDRHPHSPDQPPLLIFNGIGANAKLLAPFMDALPTPSLTFELPGMGASPANVLWRRFNGWADLAQALLKQLEIDRVHVMGVSWGGALAQAFALRHGASVDRLVLAATSTGQIMFPAHPMVLSLMVMPWRYLSPSLFKGMAGMIYGGDFRTDIERVERHAELMTSNNLFNYLGQLFSIAGWTSVFDLHKLTLPTLILAGEDDPIVPPANARYMANAMPNAELELYDCGHMFVVTRTEQVVARVGRFLAAH